MDTSKPTEPSTDPRVTVAPSSALPTEILASVSRIQIPDFSTPLYRVQTSRGAVTEIKPSRVLKLVADALGLTPRTRTAKTPAAAKAKK